MAVELEILTAIGDTGPVARWDHQNRILRFYPICIADLPWTPFAGGRIRCRERRETALGPVSSFEYALRSRGSATAALPHPANRYRLPSPAPEGILAHRSPNQHTVAVGKKRGWLAFAFGFLQTFAYGLGAYVSADFRLLDCHSASRQFQCGSLPMNFQRRGGNGEKMFL